MPPEVPRGLRADPVYEGGEHLVRLRWKRDPAEEVGRYFVYCYDEPANALPDLRHANAPETPNLLAIVPNVGDEVLISFLHDDPATRLTLPADAGKTKWYCVRAEDTSSCIDDEGFGNLSLPCGTVPASVYGFDARPAPTGYLLRRCCDLLVDLRPPPLPHPDGIPLRAIRNHPDIRWVEFREFWDDHHFGRFVFGTSNQIDTVVSIEGLGLPVQIEARFGLSNGQVGEWVRSGASPTDPRGETWRALLRCGPLERNPDCEKLPYWIIDPSTGGIDGNCGEFVAGAGRPLLARVPPCRSWGQTLAHRQRQIRRHRLVVRPGGPDLPDHALLLRAELRPGRQP